MTATKVIHDEVVFKHDHQLGRVALVLPVIPEAAPYRVREGVARRRIAALTGQCPCGATAVHGDVLAFEHDRGCPAATETLARAVRRWMR
jgi:hypothetical protein